MNEIQAPLTKNAIEYAWRQIAMRAGVKILKTSITGFESLDLPVYYAQPDQVRTYGPAVIVVPTSQDAWRSILEPQADSLDWLPQATALPGSALLPYDEPVPALFWGKGTPDVQRRFAEIRPDGVLVFHNDIVAATFFMLSRWEETIVTERDEHNRFQHSTSAAYRHGFLDHPIIDEYGLIFQAWLKALLPGWHPEQREFSVQLSHDIDVIQWFPNIQHGLRTAVGDLVKRRSFWRAWRSFTNTIIQVLSPGQNPYFEAIDTLAEISNQHGLKSAFYFMAAQSSPFDIGYDPTKAWFKRCIQKLQAEGFETGFHPGYFTLNDPVRLSEEKRRLDQALGKLPYGGRQHYLRFQIPDTWRHWQETGLVYDASMAYPAWEGFRCGTCHPFRPFDLQKDIELDLWERPLIVMDTTLLHYRQLTPMEAEKRILELAQRCKNVGGNFSLLWHNTTLVNEDHAWTQVYEKIVEELSRMVRSQNPEGLKTS